MSRISQKVPDSSPKPTFLKLVQRYAPWLYAFWKFSRPHTIVGTTLSVIGIYLIAVANGKQPVSLTSHLTTLIPTWLACLCGNVYIVGLNQLADVEIDRINKPHLPIASGEFSRRQGKIIVGVTGVLAILIALSQGVYLLSMVGLSLVIGTAYSLPPIRLKRYPFWASLCIFSVRGAIVNLGLFLHFNPGLPIPTQVWAITAFILVFTFAIAIFKDMPDTEGDRQYNISTLTLQLGQTAVFNLSRWVLTVCYVGIVLAGLLLLAERVNLPLLVGSHLFLLGWFWFRSFNVNLQDKVAIAKFYQFIWKLFFLEYLLFPIACLLA